MCPSGGCGWVHCFLRWHYPDRFDGSVARATLSARLSELPGVVVVPSEHTGKNSLSGC
jgi:hypothetical protein